MFLFLQKYATVQQQIFEFCQKHNLHFIVSDMLNKAFLNHQENPQLFMANYLLAASGTTLEDHESAEIVSLRSQVATYREQEASLLSKIEMLERRYSALERQVKNSDQAKSQTSQPVVAAPTYSTNQQSQLPVCRPFIVPQTYLSRMGLQDPLCSNFSYSYSPPMVSIPPGNLPGTSSGLPCTQTSVKAEDPLGLATEKSRAKKKQTESSDSSNSDESESEGAESKEKAHDDIVMESVEPSDNLNSKAKSFLQPNEDVDMVALVDNLEREINNKNLKSSLCLSEESEDEDAVPAVQVADSSTSIIEPVNEESNKSLKMKKLTEEKGREPTSTVEIAGEEKTVVKAKLSNEETNQEKIEFLKACSIVMPASVQAEVVDEEFIYPTSTAFGSDRMIVSPEERYKSLSDLVKDLTGESDSESGHGDLVIDESFLGDTSANVDTNSIEIDNAVKLMEQTIIQNDDVKEINVCIKSLLDDKDDLHAAQSSAPVDLNDSIELQLMIMESSQDKNDKDNNSVSLLPEEDISDTQSSADQENVIPETKLINRSNDDEMDDEFVPDYEADDL